MADAARDILIAAEDGLLDVKNDSGFRFTVYLLTQIAARRAGRTTGKPAWTLSASVGFRRDSI